MEAAASAKADVARDELQQAMRRGGELWRKLKQEQAPEAAEEVRKSLQAIAEQGESLSAEAKAELERLLEEMEPQETNPGAEANESVDGAQPSQPTP